MPRDGVIGHPNENGREMLCINRPSIKPMMYQALSASHQCFQLFLVAGELADAFGQLFGGHGVFVHRPAELAFVQLLLGLAGIARLEQAWQFALVV